MMELLEVEPPIAGLSPKSVGPEAGRSEKMIRFHIGARAFCVKAAAVAEVVRPLTPAQVPNSPGWLLGIAGYRGDIVAILDPAFVIEETCTAWNDSAKAIVFHRIGESLRLALPVNSVNEIFEIALPTAPERSGGNGAATTLAHPDGDITFIDPEGLLTSLSPP